jgi:hypothetical protein
MVNLHLSFLNLLTLGARLSGLRSRRRRTWIILRPWMWLRRRAVAKRRVSTEEGARLPVSRAGRQERLSLPAAASTGEGELRSLFAGEELRIMLFNYREMGIIPKVEPM